MANPTFLTIVVACRNESQAITPFLDSLVSQDMSGFRWEAIIADGMSTDDTVEQVLAFSRRHPNIRLIHNPEQIVATGLNRAIQSAAGEFIIRMDAHTRYAPDYCRRCVSALLETGADNVGGPARTEVRTLKQRAIAAAYHSRFSTGGARFHDTSFKGWVDTVPYGCWRKSIFSSIGLFDEALVRNQDDEFNLRTIRAGGKIWQDPEILSWYSPRSTFGALFRQYFQYGFWKVAVIRRHRVPGSWRHLVPSLFVLFTLSSAASTLLALVLHLYTWAAISGYALLALSGTYLLLATCAAIAAAYQSGYGTLPYLPFAFATYHVSYGLGFLIGLGRSHLPTSSKHPTFAGLSR